MFSVSWSPREEEDYLLVIGKLDVFLLEFPIVAHQCKFN